MKPLLVLQMQRMGDLILTFPLLGWLARHNPGHPVWTVAEPRFFSALHRQGRDAHIHVLILFLYPPASVLRQALFGNIHCAQQLDAR